MSQAVAEAGTGMTMSIEQNDRDALLRHYALAGPLMVAATGPVPFVWSTLPNGLSGPCVFHGPLSPHTKAKAPTVDVPSASGTHRYPLLSTARIEGLVRHGAVEIYSWAPTSVDPTRAGYARILLEVPSRDPRALEAGIAAVELVLLDATLQWLRVYDGGNGAALWIPFSDAPLYPRVRAWLRAESEEAVRRNPELLTLEPNTHGGPPVHIHVSTNAAGRFSVMPYSVRAKSGFPVAIAIDPHDPRAAGFANGQVRASGFAAWIREHGDPFANRPPEFHRQAFGERAAAYALGAQASHGPIVRAAIAVLQDGRSHDAGEILRIAGSRGAIDAATTRKYVYTSLIEYIARANGNGRKAAIVQNADRSFRLNEPPDDWPDVEPDAGTGAQAPASAAVAGAIERLNASVSDAEAFETAVCAAFEQLGFVVRHVGGQKAPDGFADAPLGPLGYRTTIECKSADEGINDPNVFEAAKFREAYGAQYCALVARAFSGEIELVKELHVHGVSAWTVDDLVALMQMGAGPHEVRPLFAAGFAADGLDDLRWEREHGRAKRVRYIAEALLRTGWTTQTAYRGEPASAPRITDDVAMVLVNQDLSAHESPATCSRDDVLAAFAYLASPLVGQIAGDAEAGIVVVRPLDCGAARLRSG